MSRPPKPTRLKLIQGNPGGRSMAKQLAREPQPDAGAAMPPGLSPSAQAHWSIIATQLTESQILTGLDAVALAVYCEVFARWRELADKVAAYGVATKTERGGVKVSPFWVAFVQATAELRRLSGEFGMTPSSRARVTVMNGSLEDDPFADF